MQIEVNKIELINLIKSVNIPYVSMLEPVSLLGEWHYDINGPTKFVWNTDILLGLEEKALYELYKDLQSGKLYGKDI